MSSSLRLRAEQLAAIAKTYDYWQSNAAPRRFLWNAKPRFGKTIAAYRFAEQIHAQRILILTNRPAAADSWAQDFFAHVVTDHVFAAPHSSTIFANGAEHHIYSRAELTRHRDLLDRPLIFFISLQDLKGHDAAADISTIKTKNQWIFDVRKKWDLVIIDEGHEGIKTARSRQLFRQLKSDFTLVLSGTPFRALADRDFSDAQIFNWSYFDEQRAKQQVAPGATNPYADLPDLQFFTATLSDFLASAQPPAVQSTTFDPACYDLGEFFRVQNGEFCHAALVRAWLDRLAQEFQQLPARHSLWLLSGVSECKALQKSLAEHPFFQDFQVVLAAGKTENYASRRKILDQVRRAIGPHPLATRTITLSCGQLTTGVTVPAWSAVVLAYNSTDLSRVSAAQYLQAVFRAQTPATMQTPATAQTPAPAQTSAITQTPATASASAPTSAPAPSHSSAAAFIKPHAYIFDFLPDRVCQILTDYAVNLCAKTPTAALADLGQYLKVFFLQSFDTASGSSSQAQASIWRALAPVDIIALPRRLAAKEIVDGGFTASNKLFDSAQMARLAAVRPQDFLADSLIELARQPQFAKLAAKSRQQLQNLAALETFLDDAAADKYDFSAFSAAEQKLLHEATHELRRLARAAARKKSRQLQKDFRNDLRQFSRTIPLLLHANAGAFIDASPRPQLTAPHFATLDQCPYFAEITGYDAAKFQRLLRAGYFDLENLDLAIQEFLRREIALSDYHVRPALDTIFDFIPAPHSHFVFTPPSVAVKMADRLSPHFFHSSSITFFDPAAKSGLLLAEIARRLFQNLRPQFANDYDCLAHILTHQLFACTPSPVARVVTLQTLLAPLRFSPSKLPPNKLSQIEQQLAQHIIYNSEGVMPDMKFNVIISNPPYEAGRRQIYADFYKRAVDLNPEQLCMIFPLGWQKVTNHNGLGQLNHARYKRDPHLVSIDHYYETGPGQIFPNLGTGGVNIVLRDLGHDNAGQIQKLEYGQPAGTMILPLAASEIAKPAELICLIEQFRHQPKMDALGSARKPYGFYADPLKHPEKYGLILKDRPTAQVPKSAQSAQSTQTAPAAQSAQSTQPADVRLFGLLPDGQRGFKYIARASLPKQSPCLDAYKLFVPKAWGNMSTRIGLGGSYANICVAAPGDACSETFIEFGPFATRAAAIKMAKYFMTKFFRALLFLAKDTQNTPKDKYRYIPVPDLDDPIWQQEIAALDPWLADHFALPSATRQLIATRVQPRSELNIEIL